jgi:hypothetical protein
MERTRRRARRVGGGGGKGRGGEGGGCSMSLSLTCWAFRYAQCMMSRDNRGGRSMRGTSTARIQLSGDPVENTTV